jgi:hypothetical protein
MKMKVFQGCVLMSIALLFAGSCVPFRIIKGDGDLVTQEITIRDYEEIDVSGSSLKFNYVMSNDAPELTITVDQNIYEKYDFMVSGSKLQIKPKKEYEHAHFAPTKFTVTTNSSALRKVEAAGSFDFTVNSPLNTNELTLDLAGSCMVDLTDSVIFHRLDVDIAGSGTLNAFALFGESLDGDIAGSGRLNLGGQVAKTSVEIAGSGTVRAFDLQVEDLKCEIAGSGNIEISVSNSIRAEVAGSGNIKYRGNPQDIHKNVAGSGSIKKVD